jgi:hypothetical protein
MPGHDDCSQLVLTTGHSIFGSPSAHNVDGSIGIGVGAMSLAIRYHRPPQLSLFTVDRLR